MWNRPGHIHPGRAAVAEDISVYLQSSPQASGSASPRRTTPDPVKDEVVAGLRGKIDLVEFRDVNAQPDGDVTRVAIEILKVHPGIEYAPFVVQLTLYAYMTAVVIKNDTGLILDEPTGFIELCHSGCFIHTRHGGEVDVLGESGIQKICFPETIAALEDQYLLKGCRAV